VAVNEVVSFVYGIHGIRDKSRIRERKSTMIVSGLTRRQRGTVWVKKLITNQNIYIFRTIILCFPLYQF
jgi:hypothetical protein